MGSKQIHMPLVIPTVHARAQAIAIVLEELGGTFAEDPKDKNSFVSVLDDIPSLEQYDTAMARLRAIHPHIRIAVPYELLQERKQNGDSHPHPDGAPLRERSAPRTGYRLRDPHASATTQGHEHTPYSPQEHPLSATNGKQSQVNGIESILVDASYDPPRQPVPARIDNMTLEVQRTIMDEPGLRRREIVRKVGHSYQGIGGAFVSCTRLLREHGLITHHKGRYFPVAGADDGQRHP